MLGIAMVSGMVRSIAVVGEWHCNGEWHDQRHSQLHDACSGDFLCSNLRVLSESVCVCVRVCVYVCACAHVRLNSKAEAAWVLGVARCGYSLPTYRNVASRSRSFRMAWACKERLAHNHK